MQQPLPTLEGTAHASAIPGPTRSLADSSVLEFLPATRASARATPHHVAQRLSAVDTMQAQIDRLRAVVEQQRLRAQATRPRLGVTLPSQALVASMELRAYMSQCSQVQNSISRALGFHGEAQVIYAAPPIDRCEEVLSRYGDANELRTAIDLLRATAFYAHSSHTAGHLPQSEEFSRRSQALVSQLYETPDVGVAHALQNMAFLAMHYADLDRARSYFNMSSAVLQSAGLPLHSPQRVFAFLVRALVSTTSELLLIMPELRELLTTVCEGTEWRWNAPWTGLMCELRIWAETGSLQCSPAWLLSLLRLLETGVHGRVLPQLGGCYLHSMGGAVALALGNAQVARQHADECTRCALSIRDSAVSHMLPACYVPLNWSAFVHSAIECADQLENDVVLLEQLGKCFPLAKLLAAPHRAKLQELQTRPARSPSPLPSPMLPPVPAEPFVPSTFVPINEFEPDVSSPSYSSAPSSSNEESPASATSMALPSGVS